MTRTLSAIVVAVVSVALIGGQAGAAEPNRLPPKPETRALKLQQGGSAAKTTPAQVGSQDSHPLKRKGKKKKKKRRTQPTQGYATVGGYSNFTHSTATLQIWNGTSWLNLGQVITGAGTYYAQQVPTGPLPYRYWVTAEVFWSQSFFPCGGCAPVPYTCRQTWADDSSSVVAAPGQVYSNLNTALRPWGPAQC